MKPVEEQQRKRVSKGIIFACDSGEGFHPATQVVAKGLLPVYDKPMVYYAVSTLMLAGIREILVVSDSRNLTSFMELLGNGSRLAINISYAEQEKHKGAGGTLLTAQRFIGEDSVCLILVDDIFSGNLNVLRGFMEIQEGATIFAADGRVSERHGRVEFDTNGRALRLEENARNKSSAWAVPGLYVYDNRAIEIVELLTHMTGGRMGIMDVNRQYLLRGRLRVHKLPQEVEWLEVENESGLLEAANLVARWERRHGAKVGCIEEAAFRMGYISAERLEVLIRDFPEGGYRDYLARLAAESMAQKRKCAGKATIESSVAVASGVR